MTATPNTLLSADTNIGDLMDNAQSRAVLEEYIPEMIASPRFSMARMMSLRTLQSFAAEQLTDAKMADIEAALLQLSAK